MVTVDATADEVLEAMRRGLVSPAGVDALLIGILKLRLMLKEEELAFERHQHQTTMSQLKGQRDTVHKLQESLRDPRNFDALPLKESNGEPVGV